MSFPSLAAIIASRLQKRFFSQWIPRTTLTYGVKTVTYNRDSLKNFHSNVIATKNSLGLSKLAIPLDVTNDTSQAGKGDPGNTTVKTKRSRKRPKIDWTPEADTLLLELRTVHNKTWLEIGQKLDREPATCMTRYESCLNPALKEFWTKERDDKLDELVTSSKGWPEIAEILGVHRLACMERWRQLGLKEVSQGDRGIPIDIQKSLKTKESQRKDRKLHLEMQGRIEAQELLNDIRNTTSALKTVQQVDRNHDELGWNLLLRDEDRFNHHRSWKKKTRLDDFSQLYLMNPGWSAKEETILIQFVLGNGLDKWEVLANEVLGGRFTASQCRTCWKNLDMPVINSLNTVDPHQHQGTNNADTITATESLSPSDPQNNTNGNLREQLSHEASIWSKDQQIRFWKLWNQYGQDWSKIADSMGNHTSVASCEKYFSDITEKLLQQSGGSSEVDNNKEKIKALAKAITQDFKDTPAQQSASDGLLMTGSDTTATPTPTPNLTPAPGSKATSFTWDKETSVRLQVMVRQIYKTKTIHIDDINWKWVAHRVSPDISSRICKNHWRFLYTNSNQVVWTHDDIKRLEEGVRLLGPKKMAQIRDHFLPHMTKDDVVRYWFRISDKAATINEKDYFKLLEAADDIIQNKEDTEEFARDQYWMEISKRMGEGWKKLPCRRVWESSYKYLIHHTNWTENEDTLLLRVVKFVGRDDWFTVAKAMQINRSPWQCRLRWCQLLDPVNLNSKDLFVKGEKYC